MMTSRTSSMVRSCGGGLAAERQAQQAEQRDKAAADQPRGPRAAGEVGVDEAEQADAGQETDGTKEEQDEEAGDDVGHDPLGGDDRLVPHRPDGALDLVGYLIGPIRHVRSLHTPPASPFPCWRAVRSGPMSRLVDPQSHLMPAVRLVGSLAVGLILAAVGGMILGEYTFQGAGIQWLAISGGAGMGGAMAWVLNRV